MSYGRFATELEIAPRNRREGRRPAACGGCGSRRQLVSHTSASTLGGWELGGVGAAGQQPVPEAQPALCTHACHTLTSPHGDLILLVVGLRRVDCHPAGARRQQQMALRCADRPEQQVLCLCAHRVELAFSPSWSGRDCSPNFHPSHRPSWSHRDHRGCYGSAERTRKLSRRSLAYRRERRARPAMRVYKQALRTHLNLLLLVDPRRPINQDV